MGLFSRSLGKEDKKEPPKKSLQDESKGNPSITIWVRDQNPDEILLTTLLVRFNDEKPGQLPQIIRDMLNNKIPLDNTRFAPLFPCSPRCSYERLTRGWSGDILRSRTLFQGQHGREVFCSKPHYEGVLGSAFLFDRWHRKLSPNEWPCGEQTNP